MSFSCDIIKILRDLKGGVVYCMLLDQLDDNFVWEEIKF